MPTETKPYPVIDPATVDGKSCCPTLPCLKCGENAVWLDPCSMNFKCTECNEEIAAVDAAEKVNEIMSTWSKVLAWVALAPDAE